MRCRSATSSANVTSLGTGNHSGWFSYAPTKGDVRVQPFSKNQTLTGKFYPLRHIHVDG